MMKKFLSLVILIFVQSGYSMDVLVTYFDPFGGSEVNNSEVVAKKLKATFKDETVNLSFCQIRTIFDKGFGDVQTCIGAMDKRPGMIISLGEAGCSGIKIETRAKNYDRSYSADNDGIDRHGVPVYPGEADALGVTLPIQKAYCSLTSAQKKKVYISNDAGSFVCNNTLYHMLRNLDIPSTFIHVATKACTRRGRGISEMAGIIGSMISKMSTENLSMVSQPADKFEVKELLQSSLNSCEKSFYHILKGEY